MRIPSGIMSLTSRPKASSSRTVDEAMSVSSGGVKSTTVAIDLRHRALVLEVDRVAHAAHYGRGPFQAGQFAREGIVGHALHPIVVGVKVVDEPFAVVEREQRLLAAVVADGHCHSVE